jgi:hypothetical protein
MNSDLDLNQMQNDAADEAAHTIEDARTCLHLLTENQEKLSISDAVLLIGFAIIYQLSLESQRQIDRLDDLIESIDCSKSDPAEYWMTSDLAAIDKAKQLSIEILPEYSTADLRYKIYCAIHEAV